MINRRNFISSSIVAGLGATVANALPVSVLSTSRMKTESNHPLNILILGGTSFLGPHQIAYALERGHTISTFTRGRTVPTIHQDLFDQVESLVGDRENDLEALRGRKWDAVIDNSGRRVSWTRDSAALLKDSVDQYLYTSSTGVYYPYLTEDIGESQHLVREVPAGLDEVRSMEYGYGVMKANSEVEVTKAFGADRTIVVRPTYMMGPADRTDRFTYWPLRLARGGEVMVPGKTNDPVQYIDVRDVAGLMIRLIEQRLAGTFNAVGPPSATDMQAFVHGAHSVFSSAAEFIVVDDYEFLSQHGIHDSVPWIMPTKENYGSARINSDWGIENGLTHTPLADSVRDIYEWWHSGAVSSERMQNMISGPNSLMAREAELLKAWAAS